MSPTQGLCRHEPLLIFPSLALAGASEIHAEHEEWHFGGVVPLKRTEPSSKGFGFAERA
jgi:hypothetical protein